MASIPAPDGGAGTDGAEPDGMAKLAGTSHRWSDQSFGGVGSLGSKAESGVEQNGLAAQPARMVRGSLKGTSPTEKIWKRFNDEISNRKSAPDILRVYENYSSQF